MFFFLRQKKVWKGFQSRAGEGGNDLFLKFLLFIILFFYGLFCLIKKNVESLLSHMLTPSFLSQLVFVVKEEERGPCC
jgi:hypothetical protein